MADPEREFTSLYFGYSSNLSPMTMKQRCPGSLYVGLAILKDYKWIINSTSYASIIPSPGDVVYGSLYFLSGKDEQSLDLSEGVPWLYEKQYLDLHRVTDGREHENSVKSLAYVDIQRLDEGTIEPDYVVWVQKAIQHGLQSGVPSDYVEKYLRPWRLGGAEDLLRALRFDAAVHKVRVGGDAVKKYGAEPLRFVVNSQEEVHDAIVKNGITIVFFLIDALKNESQLMFINALAKVKKETGKEVHFLHTSGAKIFSNLAGAPVDVPLLDTRPDLYEVQKKQEAPFGFMQEAVETNNAVIELAEAKGVRAYIFAPCIVYGKSTGFGNPISIQTVAIFKAAKAAGGVYSPNKLRPTWPVCHISENSNLYIRILHGILAGENIGYGKSGYFLASPGSVVWDDLYAAMAEALANRKVISNANFEQATDVHLEKMAAGIGCPKEMVVVQLGGLCTSTPQHGAQIGWKAKYHPEHILEAADEEVGLIMSKL
ncbi:hypothetical protein IFR05_006538 [Cadophora sp. M221]|nr:hypothetical protein IFR05_006538 [Cadophora sp. M221]